MFNLKLNYRNGITTTGVARGTKGTGLVCMLLVSSKINNHGFPSKGILLR